jgi:hypothetical protein
LLLGIVFVVNNLPNTRRFLSPKLLLQNTADDITPESMRAASRAGSQSEAVFTRTL